MKAGHVARGARRRGGPPGPRADGTGDPARVARGTGHGGPPGTVARFPEGWHAARWHAFRTLASQRRARAEEEERLVREHQPRTAPGELAKAWARRREQTARLVHLYKIDPAKVDYRELRGRPGQAARQLREAQEHLLGCRFPQADEALGRAVQYLRESPGGDGRGARSVEELRAWIRGRVKAARRP